MRTYYIYKATNKINGKSYIGQTSKFEKRKYEHIHLRDGKHEKNSIFHEAIDKYGEENFDWEILASVPGKDFANSVESMMIDSFNTFKPNGYNLTKGGDGGSMWNAIPVVRLTLDGEFVKRYDSASEAEMDGFYYSGVLRSCRDKSVSTKGYIFMFENEYKKFGARRLEKKIIKTSRSREIYQCNMNGEIIKKYPTIAEAERELGIRHTSIVGCAKGKYKSAGGYIFVYVEDFPIKDIDSHKIKVKGRKVAKLDKDTGEVLATYDRMTDAARELNGSNKVICKALNNPKKLAYGYKWISID